MNFILDNLLLFLSALVAEIAGTISGFGSSSILLPIAHHLFDYQNAIVLIAIYHIFGNTSRLSLTYEHWDKWIFLLFGIPSVVATMIGASLVEEVNPDILKIILAIVLTLFSIYSLWKPRWRVTPTPMIGRIGGALSGFTAGLIGTGWVLRGAFMTAFGLAKERYIATIASVALLVDFTRIPLYFDQGFLSMEHLPLIPILFVIAFIGTWIGKKIVNHISTELMRKIILIGIIVMSIWLGWWWYTNL